MNEFGDILGALFSGLLEARRIADEYSASIAEYYKQHPLLEGMSIPRIRIPELSAEIPILITAIDKGEPSEGAEANEIHSAAKMSLLAAMEKADKKLPNEAASFFKESLLKELSKLAVQKRRPVTASRESAERAASVALRNTFAKKEFEAILTPEEKTAIFSEVRQAAGTASVKKPLVPPRLKISAVTSEVKEKADPASITRIHIMLKEEGLEWSTGEFEPGIISKRLTPE